MIHFRLTKALIKAVDHQAVDWELPRDRTIERLLESELKRFGAMESNQYLTLGHAE